MAIWGSYYRENIDIFVEEYLQLDFLKWFQTALLVMMDRSRTFLWIAARGMGKSFLKVIWAIKGSPMLNSECAVLLREGFRSSKIRLLITEYDGEALLSDIKGYNSLSPLEKVTLQKPYVHTTLLIDELVKLQHEESGGRVRVYEKSGMRKDR